ncbi:hypothetical protein [Streptomyces phaeofaciens]|uniref:hypothetical protein n=1 Tax=Streptomyces phaeofaciens TaxID=68254 RepID=UPI00368BC58A
MEGRILRRAAALGLGAVWWWAVVRLAVAPSAGVLEGAVVAGGWGLSLLPVHCAAKARAVGAVEVGRWGMAWRSGGEAGAGAGLRGCAGASHAGGLWGVVTRAWRRRRSGGGSGPL